jgi:hypothetical protein
MVTMALSAVTGAALLYGNPLRYYVKPFFWIKMTLMFLAGLNAMVFHLTTYRSVSTWDTSAVVPRGARLAGAFGLLLWAGVIGFGRITAYNWMDLE